MTSNKADRFDCSVGPSFVKRPLTDVVRKTRLGEENQSISNRRNLDRSQCSE